MDKRNNDGIIPIAGTKNTDRSLDVIFIHGLGGDAFSTWQYEDEAKYFWPKALRMTFLTLAYGLLDMGQHLLGGLKILCQWKIGQKIY